MKVLVADKLSDINILLNSTEAVSDGGEIEIVTKKQQRDGAWIIVQISDDGPGVSQKILTRIFDPFFSQKKNGAGLGLTNVKKIIEAHGGQVTASLRRSNGMIIKLIIPVR